MCSKHRLSRRRIVYGALVGAVLVTLVATVPPARLGRISVSVAVTAPFAAASVYLGYVVPRWARRAGRKTLRTAGHGFAVGAGPGPAHDSMLIVVGLAMRIAVWLMPPTVGRRWLAEVSSFLAECDPRHRRVAMWSWVRGAPALIALMWVHELARRVRGAGGRKAAGQPPASL
jgi:hypothetical protein